MKLSWGLAWTMFAALGFGCGQIVVPPLEETIAPPAAIAEPAAEVLAAPEHSEPIAPPEPTREELYIDDAKAFLAMARGLARFLALAPEAERYAAMHDQVLVAYLAMSDVPSDSSLEAFAAKAETIMKMAALGKRTLEHRDETLYARQLYFLEMKDMVKADEVTSHNYAETMLARIEEAAKLLGK